MCQIQAKGITYNELYESYYEATRGLVDGGVDLILVETIFDTLNAKAAINAIKIYLKMKKLIYQ